MHAGLLDLERMDVDRVFHLPHANSHHPASSASHRRLTYLRAFSTTVDRAAKSTGQLQTQTRAFRRHYCRIESFTLACKQYDQTRFLVRGRHTDLDELQ